MTCFELLKWVCFPDLCFPCGFVNRKHSADSSPRFVFRGLYTPDAGPQPTEFERLCSSGPKGLLHFLTFFKTNFLFLLVVSKKVFH